jgi:cyclohexa-1,5-dienecarbonyl-CoA hydratase
MHQIIAPPLRIEWRHAGTMLRLVLERPKANLISLELIAALRRSVQAFPVRLPVKLVTIEGAGAHFSYGAVVEEHAPDRIASVLAELHALLRELVALPAPTLAIVRGRCLGGGFELALACDAMIAADDAVLGLPEIALGVFPPAGAALLPVRVGAARAARAVLEGEALPARWWADAGLIEHVVPAADLDHTVDRWFEQHVAPRSATALRFAARAVRWPVREALDRALPELERLYLDDLMKTADAVEGIRAFTEKRAPRWGGSSE